MIREDDDKKSQQAKYFSFCLWLSIRRTVTSRSFNYKEKVYAKNKGCLFTIEQKTMTISKVENLTKQILIQYLIQ